MGAGITPVIRIDSPLETNQYVGLAELTVDPSYEIGFGHMFVRSSDGMPYYISSTGDILPMTGTPAFEATMYNNSSGTISLANATTYMGVIVEYVIHRGSLVSQGCVSLYYNGTYVGVDHEHHGDAVNVAFDGSVSSGSILLNYTVDNSGNDCTMSYLARYEPTV